MRLRPMFPCRTETTRDRRAQMTGHTLAMMEDFHRGCRGADLHFTLRQLIGNAVPMAVKLDVVVDVDAGGLPLTVAVTLAGQRLQRGPVQHVEQRLARTFLLAEGPRIEPGQQFTDGFVDLAQGEERPLSQRHQNPTFDDQHTGLYLSFIARFSRPCRNDRDPIVGGHLFVGAVDAGLIAAGLGDTGLQVVGNDDFRHAGKVVEGTNVGSDPVAESLCPGGFGEGVVTGAEHGDEQLGIARFAR